MCGRHVELQLLDQPREAWGLTLGKFQDESPQRRRVDDRVFEGAFEPTTDKPRVESVMAMLDQHSALRKAQKCPPGILEFRRTDQHRPIDVVSLSRIWVDGRPTIDQGVEERQRLVEGEPLGAQLEDQEWSVARRLDVEGDELRLVQRGQRPDLGRVDRNLLPGHQLNRAAGLEINRLRAHRAKARARRAHRISSPLRARSSKTAAE